MSKSAPEEADYRVVAATDDDPGFYNPQTKQFGLAGFARGDSPPRTMGVRGDLIGTSCTMQYTVSTPLEPCKRRWI
jgi:hypothetical protein